MSENEDESAKDLIDALSNQYDGEFVSENTPITDANKQRKMDGKERTVGQHAKYQQPIDSYAARKDKAMKNGTEVLYVAARS